MPGQSMYKTLQLQKLSISSLGKPSHPLGGRRCETHHPFWGGEKPSGSGTDKNGCFQKDPKNLDDF